jgi:hypothetical protein
MSYLKVWISTTDWLTFPYVLVAGNKLSWICYSKTCFFLTFFFRWFVSQSLPSLVLSFFFFSIGSHDEVITKWFNKYETHLKSKGEKNTKKRKPKCIQQLLLYTSNCNASVYEHLQSLLKRRFYVFMFASLFVYMSLLKRRFLCFYLWNFLSTIL